jgi:crossover junction endodeoxyribonuclease RuvC
MRIIAIDPGYERLGVALMEKNPQGKEIVLYSDCFITPRTITHSERLSMISKEIDRLIDIYEPKALSVETLFFSKNQKTALQVAEARGVILCTAANKNIEVREFKPVDIKIAVTGYGRSDKTQITAMVKRLVKLDKPKALDDEYDAIAIGLTFFATEKTMDKTVIHKLLAR